MAIDLRDIDTEYKSGFEAVRYLRFGAFACGADAADHAPLIQLVSFALQRRNLISVILVVQEPYTRVEFDPLVGDYLKAPTPKKIRSAIGFDKLLELERLKVIEFQTDVCVEHGYNDDVIAQTKEFMQELTVSIQEEVVARGKGIRVHCIDDDQPPHNIVD